MGYLLDHPWVEHPSAGTPRHDYTHTKRATAREVMGDDRDSRQEEESDGKSRSKSLSQEDLVELLRLCE